MSHSDLEARDYALAMVSWKLHSEQLAEQRKKKSELVRLRDAISKHRTEDVRIEIGNTVFKLPYDDARKSIVQRIEACDKDIEVSELQASKSKRDMDAFPKWLRDSMHVP